MTSCPSMRYGARGKKVSGRQKMARIRDRAEKPDQNQ